MAESTRLATAGPAPTRLSDDGTTVNEETVAHWAGLIQRTLRPSGSDIWIEPREWAKWLQQALETVTRQQDELNRLRAYIRANVR